MAVQNRQDNTTEPLILSENSLVINADIASNRQRTTDLLYGTVMAMNATTRRWVPFNDLTQTNGESVPRGIYLGDDILAADIVDEHIADVPILVGNAWVNESLVVWDDGTLNADSIVNPANIEARTARVALSEAAGIFLKSTVAISQHENL